MKSREEAQELAETMRDIGREVGLQVRAVLSGMDEPLGWAVGNALEGNNWYDESGNLIKSIAEGAGQYTFTKTNYDSIGRPDASVPSAAIRAACEVEGM